MDAEERRRFSSFLLVPLALFIFWAITTSPNSPRSLHSPRSLCSPWYQLGPLLVPILVHWTIKAVKLCFWALVSWAFSLSSFSLGYLSPAFLRLWLLIAAFQHPLGSFKTTVLHYTDSAGMAIVRLCCRAEMRMQGPVFQTKLFASSQSDSINTVDSTISYQLCSALSFTEVDYSVSTIFTAVSRVSYLCSRIFDIGVACIITEIPNYWQQSSHSIPVLFHSLWLSVAHFAFKGILCVFTLITTNTKLGKLVCAWKLRCNTELYEELPIRKLEAEEPKLRILAILPGRPHEPIRCRLYITGLVSSCIVPYEALSYVWGPPDLSQTIEINQRPFCISTSLRHALGRLRYPDSFRRIWIDAICINQLDKADRSAQVLLMHQVYSRASRVVVWLGSLEPLDLNNLNEHTLTDPGLGIQHNDGAIRAFSDLLRRPWWTRVWATQEFVLARDVIFCCGSHTFDQDRFLQLANAFAPLPTFPRDSVYLREFRTLVRHREARLSLEPAPAAEATRTTDLLSLIYDFRSKRATEPRDKIFALQGLSRVSNAAMPEAKDPNDLSEILVQPDYNQIPEVLCVALVIQHIRKTGSLSAIALAECSRPRPPLTKFFGWTVPSWCPNFVDQESVDCGAAWQPFWTGLPGEDLVLFSAAGTASTEPIPESRPPYSLRDHDSFWQLKVTVVSNFSELVQSVGPLAGDSFQSLIQPTTGFSASFPGKSLLLSWKALAYKALDRRDISSKLSFEDDFSLTITAGKFTAAEDATSKPYLAAVRLACAGRRLYITEKGSFGLGPADLQIGHEVCVMLGMQTPAILSQLRASRRTTKPTLWGYVGQAYQHGLMRYEGDINEDIGCGRASLETRILG